MPQKPAILALAFAGLFLAALATPLRASSPSFVGAASLVCGQDGNNLASATYSYNVPALTSNALVLVSVVWSGTGNMDNITGMSFGGTALSWYKTVTNTAVYNLYYLPVASLASGSTNLVVNYSPNSANKQVSIEIQVFGGVNQSSPFGANTTHTDTSSPIADTLSTAANAMVVDYFWDNNNAITGLTASGGSTVDNTCNASGDNTASTHQAFTSSGNNTMNFTWSPSGQTALSWQIEIDPAGASGSSTNTPTASPTASPTATPTASPSPLGTFTWTPTWTKTCTPTSSPTNSPNWTATVTPACGGTAVVPSVDGGAAATKSGNGAGASFAGITGGSGSNRLLVVRVLLGTTTLNTITGISWGAQALTRANSALVKTAGNPTGSDYEFWYLVAPATGSNTLALTWTGADNYNLSYVFYQNVNQATPLGAHSSNPTLGSASSYSYTIATTGNYSLITDFMIAGTWNSSATEKGISGQTQEYAVNRAGPNDIWGADQGTTTAGNYTPIYAMSNNSDQYWSTQSDEIMSSNANPCVNTPTNTPTCGYSGTVPSLQAGGATNFTNSWNETVALTGSAGPNRLLLVRILLDTTTLNYVTHMTWAGVSLTRFNSIGVKTSQGTGRDFETWYLVNPASGANNLEMTWPAQITNNISYAFYQNVNQSTPLGAFNSNPNQSSVTSYTSNITTTAPYSLISDFFVDGNWNNANAPTPGAGQTQEWPKTTGSPNDIYGDDKATGATAGANSLSYTFTDTGNCCYSGQTQEILAEGSVCVTTPTDTPSVTPSVTPSFTVSPSPSNTPTPSASPSVTPSATPTLSSSPSVSPSNTPSSTATPTLTVSPTASATPSFTPSPSQTPLMQLIKSANRSTATIGDTITFCLQYSNDSSQTRNINVWDTVPSYTSYLGSTPAGTFASGVISWTVNNVPSGGNGSLCFGVRVTGYPP